MKPTLYLETTIPSYLVARMSRDLVVASRQELTHEWWDASREEYELYVSELVLREVSRGDTELAARRLEIVGDLPRLDVTSEVESLAAEFIDVLRLGESAEVDVYHLATATVYEIDYLLTWNLAHLANARVRHSLEKWSLVTGRSIPTVCTPGELVGMKGAGP
ncbi:MAG: type II toxin-antitoxin system VapC family toxin [Planctomycetota bacterium]|jgi:predicted nucleic acid-binding protein